MSGNQQEIVEVMGDYFANITGGLGTADKVA